MNIKTDELAALWNAQVDLYNTWDSLDTDEQIMFAQKQALIAAAERFEGIRPYNWMAEDGYSKAFSIAVELRFMASE